MREKKVSFVLSWGSDSSKPCSQGYVTSRGRKLKKSYFIVNLKEAKYNANKCWEGTISEEDDAKKGAEKKNKN